MQNFSTLEDQLMMFQNQPVKLSQSVSYHPNVNIVITYEDKYYYFWTIVVLILIFILLHASKSN